MVTGVLKERFVGSVVRWLSMISACSSGLEDCFNRLYDPKVLILVFKLILDDKFEVSIGNEDTTISVVDRLVEYFSTAETKIFEELSTLKLLLDAELLMKENSRQLHILCILILRIGLSGLKSSLCTSTMSMLKPEERVELERAVYGDVTDDVYVENSIMANELKRMDTELQQRNNKVHVLEKELDRLKRLNTSMEQQLEFADEGNGALQLHRKEIERLKITNKRYKDSLSQWERDFAELQRYNTPSPMRRVRMAHHDDQLHHQHQQQQQQKELVYLQWQYNTLTQWIAKLI